MIDVAIRDRDPDVKQVALAGITGDQTLANVLVQIASEQMTFGRQQRSRRAARQSPQEARRQTRLHQVVNGALNRIGDQEILTRLALEAVHPRLALDAAKLVKGDAYLVQGALRSRHEFAAWRAEPRGTASVAHPAEHRTVRWC